MAEKRRRTGKGQQDGGAGAGGAGARRRLEHLRRSFAKFRRVHRPRTRIPQELRDEALGALRCGASEPDVRRACRITLEQLQWWQRCGARPCDPEEHTALVFPVVDEVSGVAIERTEDHAAQELELRIGGWAICIRQLER